MAAPRYTTEDMRRLAELSPPGSIPSAFLPGLGYSPVKLKELMERHGLKDDVKFLFEADIHDIPPICDDEARYGYYRFRMSVGK